MSHENTAPLRGAVLPFVPRIHARRGFRGAAGLVTALLLGAGVAGVQAQALQQQQPAFDLDTVVAERGGQSVTFAEIDARLAGMPERIRPGYMNDPERIEQLIQNLLLEKQLAALAREAKLEERRLFQVQRQQAIDALLARQALDHHIATLALPDFEQLAYEAYLADPGKFSTPERRDATQILIRTADRGEDAARVLAERALEAARKPDADFAELVRQFNEGNPGNGVLPDIVRGQTVKPFEDALFALEREGELSDIVKSDFGLHIVRLDAIKPAGRVPFERVKDTLVEKAREDFIARERRSLREQLNSLPISAEQEVVASLRERYLPERSPLTDYRDGHAAPVGGN